MSPARIVAVAQLLIDVLDDLDRRSDGQLTPAEEAFYFLSVFSRAPLLDVLALARAEMSQPALVLLAGGAGVVTSASPQGAGVQS